MFTHSIRLWQMYWPRSSTTYVFFSSFLQSIPSKQLLAWTYWNCHKRSLSGFQPWKSVLVVETANDECVSPSSRDSYPSHMIAHWRFLWGSWFSKITINKIMLIREFFTLTSMREVVSVYHLGLSYISWSLQGHSTSYSIFYVVLIQGQEFYTLVGYRIVLSGTLLTTLIWARILYSSLLC